MTFSTDEWRTHLVDLLSFILECNQILYEYDNCRFHFSNYVDHFSPKHQCATVCCFEGNLPAIFPNTFRWMVSTDKGLKSPNDLDYQDLGEYGVFVDTYDNNHTVCSKLHIPVSIWHFLTRPNQVLEDFEANRLRDNHLETDSNLVQVTKHWLEVIEDISSGKLDFFFSDKAIFSYSL